jgi:hypothetical protein
MQKSDDSWSFMLISNKELYKIKKTARQGLI